ncbi:MbtH family protein, partial [Streptomyces seoulensis]
MDENTRYQVLRNDEEQYSLWPVDVDVPAGWQPVGKEGTEAECSDYVDEVWTDMRPRSLRAATSLSAWAPRSVVAALTIVSASSSSRSV